MNKARRYLPSGRLLVIQRRRDRFREGRGRAQGSSEPGDARHGCELFRQKGPAGSWPSGAVTPPRDV